jgi:hypothetical protein
VHKSLRKYPWPIQVTVDDNLRELVKQKAAKENLSESRVVVNALMLYLGGERTILSRLSEMQRQLNFIATNINQSPESRFKERSENAGE